MRSAAGAHPGAKNVEVSTLFAGPGRPESPERDPRARRRARGRGGGRVLPLRLALRARDARAAQRRLRRAKLRRLVARVVAPRRAAARTLTRRRRMASQAAPKPLARARARRRRGTPNRACGRDRSTGRCASVSLRETLRDRAAGPRSRPSSGRAGAPSPPGGTARPSTRRRGGTPASCVGARELDSAVRHVVRVVVPHEPGELRRQLAEDGIVDARLVQLDVDPTDLGHVEPSHLRPGRAREELDAEANPEHRPPVGEERSSQSISWAATCAALPGRGGSRRRTPCTRRSSRAGAAGWRPHEKLHSSIACPAATTTGSNSSARASGPWTTDRTLMRADYAARRRSSRPATPWPAGCAGPAQSRCC